MLQEEQIFDFIEQVHKTHGCEIIVNGVIPTLKYYLRLLENPATFIPVYERNLATDYDIKAVHRQQWQTLIAPYIDEER